MKDTVTTQLHGRPADKQWRNAKKKARIASPKLTSRKQSIVAFPDSLYAWRQTIKNFPSSLACLLFVCIKGSGDIHLGSQSRCDCNDALEGPHLRSASSYGKWIPCGKREVHDSRDGRLWIMRILLGVECASQKALPNNRTDCTHRTWSKLCTSLSRGFFPPHFCLKAWTKRYRYRKLVVNIRKDSKRRKLWKSPRDWNPAEQRYV